MQQYTYQLSIVLVNVERRHIRLRLQRAPVATSDEPNKLLDIRLASASASESCLLSISQSQFPILRSAPNPSAPTSSSIFTPIRDPRSGAPCACGDGAASVPAQPYSVVVSSSRPLKLSTSGPGQRLHNFLTSASVAIESI
jgi:hypothetical protein